MAERQRGFWIPWLFVAFFGVVVGVDATMIWIAGASWTGIATEGAYEKGLDYNRNLDAAAEAATLGWTIETALEAEAAAGGTLEVILRDKAGAPVDGAEVLATFERPTREGLDFGVALESRGGGRYLGRIEPAVAGVWNLHLVARKGEAVLVQDSRQVMR